VSEDSATSTAVAPESTPPAQPPARFARALRATAAKLLLALFRVRAIDMDRIPASGAILAGNHVSYADPVLLWCAAPRLVHFMGKAELWEIPVVGRLLTSVRAFPVRRGSADREAISAATRLLKSGELVGIFPEGTRVRGSDVLGEGQEGVAFIAMRAGVPIVPIGIDGTNRIMPEGTHMLRFPRVTMCFGEPIALDTYADLPRKERLVAITRELMERITSELERAREA